MAHVGELTAARTIDLRPVRMFLLVVLALVSLVMAGLIAREALVGPAGQQQMVFFIVSLSLMPLPAAAGMFLAGYHGEEGLVARLGLLLAAAAWFLTFAGLVTHAAVPVLICALGGVAFGAHSLRCGRARTLAGWTVTMNVCLLAAAGFLAGVVIPTAHM